MKDVEKIRVKIYLGKNNNRDFLIGVLISMKFYALTFDERFKEYLRQEDEEELARKDLDLEEYNRHKNLDCFTLIREHHEKNEG